MTVFNPTCGNGRGTKLLHVGNSCDAAFTLPSAPALTEVLEGRTVSELELDNALTERNKDVYSAIRDDKPSRLSHADRRLLSSNVFSVSETQSVGGRNTSEDNADDVDGAKLKCRSQLVSLLSPGREILQCTTFYCILLYKLQGSHTFSTTPRIIFHDRTELRTTRHHATMDHFLLLHNN